MARTREAIRPPNVLCMLTQMVKMIAPRTQRVAARPALHLPHLPPHPHPRHPHLSPLKKKRKKSSQQPSSQCHHHLETSLCPCQHLWRNPSQRGSWAPPSHCSLNRRSLQQGLQVPLRNQHPVRPSPPQSPQLALQPLPPSLTSAPLLLSPSCPHPRNAGKPSPSLLWRKCQPQNLPQLPHSRSRLLAPSPAKSPGAWSGPFAICPWTTHLWSRVGLRRCPEEVGAGLQAEAALSRKRRLSQGQKWTWRCWPTWP